MKNIITTWLLWAAIFLAVPTNVSAQAPLVYGLTFDTGNNKKIIAVMPGGPAENAGVQAGDIVRSVNGTPTGGLDNAATRALLIKQNDASLTVESNGVIKTISMSKAPMDSFGRTCVSGNCQTGQGRLRMGSYRNLEFEGEFENGSPTGETKMYNPAGDLVYKGAVKDFFAHGAGQTYGKDDSGRQVITDEGDYQDGVLVNGIIYNTDGTVRTIGQFDPVTHKVKSSFLSTVYRGKKCNLFCESIKRGPNGAVYNGKLSISESEEDSPGARVLLEMHYVDGVPNGNTKAWDYPNNVYHSIQLRNGVPLEKDLNGGMIIRIDDGVPIATEVRYSADAVSTGNFINSIVYGLFHFQTQFLAITGPSGGAGLDFFKQSYTGGNGQLLDLNAAHDNNTNTKNTGRNSNLNAGVDPRYSQADINDALRQCTNSIQYLQTQENKLNDIFREINRKNYTNMRNQYEALQGEIVLRYGELLVKYKGRIPSKDYYMIESRRNKIDALRVPLYSQY